MPADRRGRIDLGAMIVGVGPLPDLLDKRIANEKIPGDWSFLRAPHGSAAPAPAIEGPKGAHLAEALDRFIELQSDWRLMQGGKQDKRPPCAPER
ncbi:hypothetical protein M2281_003912 [Mesorhizobium soli]|nr:hypothetical protein [Mesorhizobium soli]